MKANKSFGSFFAVAVSLAAFAARAAVTEVGDETIRVDDSNVSQYADGFTFVHKNGVIEFDTSSAPTMTIKSTDYSRIPGTVKKVNNANWTMAKGISSFWGDYEIHGGVVVANTTDVFGYTWEGVPGKVIVKNGATLSLTANVRICGERMLQLEGTGVDGRGALEIPSVDLAKTVYKGIELSGEALVSIAASKYSMVSKVDPKGFALTVKGGSLYNYGSLGKGSLDFENCTYYFRDASAGISSDPDRHIVLNGRSRIAFAGTALVPAVDRPIDIAGTAALRIESTATCDFEWNTNTFAFTGPITFTNQTGMSVLTLCDAFGGTTGAVNRQLPILGPITGRGRVVVSTDSYDHRGRVYLANSNNTFSGGFYYNGMGNSSTKDGGEVLAAYPTSLGGDGTSYASVTGSYMHLDCELASDGSKWDFASFKKLANEATWQNGCFPALYALDCEEIPTVEADNGIVGKWGAIGDVVLHFEDASQTTNFTWYAGRAHLRADEPFSIKGLKLYGGYTKALGGRKFAPAVILDGGAKARMGKDVVRVGGYDKSADALQAARLIIKDAELVNTELPAEYAYANAYALGVGVTSTAWEEQQTGILEIHDGAMVVAKLVVAGGNTETAGSLAAWTYGRGAIYQYGGSVLACGSDKTDDQGLGVKGGSGSYEMYGGTFTSTNSFSISSQGQGVWTQYGGTSKFLGACRVDGANQGYGALVLRGGTMSVPGALQVAYSWQVDAFGHIAVDGETAILDHGARRISVWTNVKGNKPSFVDVNRGGVVRAAKIARGKMGDLYIGFDGGTYRIASAGIDPFEGEDTTSDRWDGAVNRATRITVYDGGMTVDTDGNAGVAIAANLQGCAGTGVKSVTMDAPLSGTDYMGSPLVMIDGDGVGASAVAEFDPATGAVTNILITASGVGYSSAEAVVYVARAEKKRYPCVVGANADAGSFTKAGGGDLTLSGTNTWGGALAVSGGTLKIASTNAIPDARALTLSGGGVLDLNHLERTITALSYGAGGGKIVNAENATLPTEADATIDIDELLAGESLTFEGDVDLSNLSITVTGDLAKVREEDRRYWIVKTTGGTCSGKPDLTIGEIPKGWSLMPDGRGIRLSKDRGVLLIVR